MLSALSSSNLAPPGWRPPAFYADRVADASLSPSEIYVVERGDTLKSIAAALFGDAQRWYWLAEANGLEGADPLACGQRLIVPHCVPAWHTPISIKPRLREFGGGTHFVGGNSVASDCCVRGKPDCGGKFVSEYTFSVYNAGEAIGDTSPTLPEAPPPPAPPKGGCGGAAMIIMIIVATMVGLGPMILSALGTTFGAATPFVAAALTAMTVNVVGQGISVLVGAQESFSWKSVAVAGITAGITQGMDVGGSISSAMGVTNPIGQAMVTGMTNSVIGQGVKMAFGMQKKFDWRDVAASAIGLGSGNRSPSTGSFAGDIVAGTLYGAARQAVAGRKVDWASAAAESVGYSVGNALSANLAAQSAGGSGGGGSTGDYQHRDNDADYQLPGQHQTSDGAINRGTATSSAVSNGYADNDAGFQLAGNYETSEAHSLGRVGAQAAAQRSLTNRLNQNAVIKESQRTANAAAASKAYGDYSNEGHGRSRPVTKPVAVAPTRPYEQLGELTPFNAEFATGSEPVSGPAFQLGNPDFVEAAKGGVKSVWNNTVGFAGDALNLKEGVASFLSGDGFKPGTRDWGWEYSNDDQRLFATSVEVGTGVTGLMSLPGAIANLRNAGAVDGVVMNSGGDRLIGTMGPARVNNAGEYNAIVNDLKAKGVDISYREGQFAYGPAPSGGRPGNIVFDPDSSLSAIKHEYGHFLDDKALGFPGQRYYYENPSARLATERRQYLGEIRTARELGDSTARRQLIEDYLSEKRYLIDNYYTKPYGSN